MGVVMLSMSTICSLGNVLLKGGPFALEFISISFLSQPSFCLCLFYRPPSSPVSIFDDLLIQQVSQTLSLLVINPRRACAARVTKTPHIF